MKLATAKRIYIAAGGSTDHGPDVWADVYEDMERIVAAESDEVAGATIEWWGGWGTPQQGGATAVEFARLVRRAYSDDH